MEFILVLKNFILSSNKILGGGSGLDLVPKKQKNIKDKI